MALHGSRLADCVKETAYTRGEGKREDRQAGSDMCVRVFVHVLYIWV